MKACPTAVILPAMVQPTIWIALGALTFVVGCKESAPPPAAKAPVAEAPAKAAPAAAATNTPTPAPGLVISNADGTPRFSIEKKPDGGYRIRDGAGQKIGKISLESDRVKVKDAAGAQRAKVKRKDNGFKLYGPDDAVVLKGKFDGERGLKLKTADDTKIGKLDGATGKVGAQRIAATVVADGIEVRRGDTIVAKVSGQMPAEPAALLALESLDLYQQAALLVFVREVF